MLEPVVLSAHRDVHSPRPLDIGEQIEVFVVLVLAALSEADSLFRFDEFDSLDPLDHLVTKLVLDTGIGISALSF
jgi:hypothetical protein